MNVKNIFVFFFLLILSSSYAQTVSPNLKVISAPSGRLKTQINKTGKTVIPNGRFITPFGKSIEVAPHPFGLSLSIDGTIAVTANSGTSPISISIIKNLKSDQPTVLQVPPGASTDKGVLASVFMGLAISPDNQIVYVAGGQANKIYLFSIDNGAKLDSVDCSVAENGQKTPDGYIGDMKLSKDGRYLYAVDQMLFRLIVVDTKLKKIVASAKTGRYPFGIILSPDGQKVYVANVGMFEYSKIGNIEAEKDYQKALDFPAFGFGTAEMEKGTRIDSMDISGLGDPNVPESFSVWAFLVKNPEKPEIQAKIKTGVLVGETIEGIPAVGGSSPNSLAVTDRYVFVSNGTNDNISVIDIVHDTIAAEISLKLHKAVKQFRGVIPFGLAVSPDQKRLFVAEAGVNAVGVIDIPTLKVIGHIPSGWFPSKLEVSPDGKTLVVSNAKGFGSGPNGGEKFQEGKEGSYIGNLMKGTVSVMTIPDDKKLASLTQKVVSNNYRIEDYSKVQKRRAKNPIPVFGGEKESPIKYLIFISKENRTYDEIFGQMKKGNGDPTIARYGYHATFTNKDYSLKVENSTVMPNHLKLATEFAMSDNFYVDSDVSADGHRWLVNTYPNEWVESSVPASYGGNRSYNPKSKAPGSLGMNGSAGAIYPEDYNEAGSMWDHLERNKIDFYNFGFGTMFEPAFYDESYKYTGIKHYVNFPVPLPMFSRTSKTYATYNMAIPDQFRISQFIKEFDEKWIKPELEMPSIITVIIPNDHGAGERPEAGYPFRESYMADNDLAVGRIVEYLSHTPFWENMAIVITEDDAQNGVDHIDAHRSVLMVISPYVKRNYVSKVHYSFGSIFKTFWNVLGVPYLNQYDAAATDFADFFTNAPDFTPYNAAPVDARIFDPKKALTPLDENFDWKAVKESPLIDDVNNMQDDQKEKPEYRMEDQKRK
ncbi:MAG TPA: beta-propeller fold lactonase family protein [Prolixibacteraceae bacterium]|nr:beta-propeller fold lactonase family protein [Prolixibacteraceae bacterium]